MEANPPSFTASKKRAEKKAKEQEMINKSAHARITASSTPRTSQTPRLSMNSFSSQRIAGSKFKPYENETPCINIFIIIFTAKMQKLSTNSENVNMLEQAAQEALLNPRSSFTEGSAETVDDLIKELEKEWPLALNHDEMEKEIISTFISSEFLKAQSEVVTALNNKSFYHYFYFFPLLIA